MKEMEIMYVESRYKKLFTPEQIEKIKDLLKNYKRINIVASVQYLNNLAQIVNEIKDKEFIIKSSKYRAFYPGQILGCDVYAADCNDCDITLSLTQGHFHVYGILEKYGKPVINIDPESFEITFYNEEIARKMQIKNMLAIDAVIKGKLILIVQTIKAGQTAPVGKIKEWLTKNGKEYYDVIFDEINFNYLNELEGDAIINTACQRIAIDDKEKLNKPIVNAEDLNDYLFHE
ncbi:MAG: diphthamide synthesis protein [Candidatus Parvarchaeota archaeon]|nr:diphthamide synthesis protein [Candidatus Rehaiarchaeum fermentans]MCW1292356.1 diphthamide synthesis protein [Candidatus Rehaiarchaeum fermentans]MCW1293032.1 diphthamide synthesis protein [Candidatus Rehaiarchaeum fermentans]MCW1293607.1 diphthamide synthesis protein [Candidatus Rehaiarchaeum fermentans]MCW1297296.1 diphthamide synthesis protein [Candidatus Rehaiarchaeum fermentans]